MNTQTALQLNPQANSIIDVIVDDMKTARVMRAFEQGRKFSAMTIAYSNLSEAIHTDNLAILDDLAALDA